MKYVGGIPIPESFTGLGKFDAALQELHERRKWIHIFPESCSWKFYAPLRPFKTGAFNMAYRFALPVVPMIITFRPRTGWRKWFGKDEPLITIHVGAPIIPDPKAPRKEETARIRDLAHKAMLEMAGIELEISGAMQRESILKKLLSPLLDKYDYILLDCPPSLGLITINALVAADYLFIPMLADTMSYYGLGMIDNICLLVQELNPAIQITGIFFTKYDTRVGLTSAIEEMVRETYGSRLMQTKIRINTKIGEAPMFHKNILEYEPDGKSVREYTALVDEMLQLMK